MDAKTSGVMIKLLNMILDRATNINEKQNAINHYNRLRDKYGDPFFSPEKKNNNEEVDRLKKDINSLRRHISNQNRHLDDRNAKIHFLESDLMYYMNMCDKLKEIEKKYKELQKKKNNKDTLHFILFSAILLGGAYFIGSLLNSLTGGM